MAVLVVTLRPAPSETQNELNASGVINPYQNLVVPTNNHRKANDFHPPPVHFGVPPNPESAVRLIHTKGSPVDLRNSPSERFTCPQGLHLRNRLLFLHFRHSTPCNPGAASHYSSAKREEEQRQQDALDLHAWHSPLSPPSPPQTAPRISTQALAVAARLQVEASFAHSGAWQIVYGLVVNVQHRNRPLLTWWKARQSAYSAYPCNREKLSYPLDARAPK